MKECLGCGAEINSDEDVLCDDCTVMYELYLGVRDQQPN